MKFMWPALLFLTLGITVASADDVNLQQTRSPGNCPEGFEWDLPMGHCMPVVDESSDSVSYYAHGRAFFTGITQPAPRGRDGFAIPNFVMTGLSKPLGATHVLQLELMLTAELWTFPDRGYPEILQIGERDERDEPYLDAQHPHSSPIMGLTLSDRFKLGTETELKLSFAPRGQSADGPIAFMHRVTAAFNPDVPLGHHVGQDVGHISSTVVGAELTVGGNRLELTAFNGEEPEPTHTSIDVGTPNSIAARYTRTFSPFVQIMGSLAYVKHPEAHHPSEDIDHVVRYSASVYTRGERKGGKSIYNTFAFGGIAGYSGAGTLLSFGDEFMQKLDEVRAFGRIEVLQRTPAQLGIEVADPDRGRWVAGLSFGASFQIAKFGPMDLSLGGLGSKYLLPGDLIGEYEGNPWTGKLYLRLAGEGSGTF